MARALAAVDVGDLAGDERGLLQVEDRADDVVDLAHPMDGVERGLGAVRVASALSTRLVEMFTTCPPPSRESIAVIALRDISKKPRRFTLTTDS